MAAPDVSHLTPSDCVAALRSFPRRYRAAFASVDPDERERRATQVGPDGRSPVEWADHAARTMALIGGALHQALVEAEPVLVPAVLDDGARDWHLPPGSVDATLDFLTTESGALADQVAAVSGDQWPKAATVAGRPSPVTALTLPREAVRTAAESLAAIERALR